MLNELYTLDRSLKRFNVGIAETHPSVKRLARSSLLIAGVNSSGEVAKVGWMGAEEAVALFKIQPSNQANFPQVSWNAPIWSLDVMAPAVLEWSRCPAADTDRRANLLQRACSGAALAKGQERAVARMREFCGELAPRFPAEEGSEFAAFPILLSRLLANTLSPEVWLRRLSDIAILTAAAGPPELLTSVETLLAGEDDKVPILFELADCTAFRCRIANPRMGAYFSRRLNATEEAGTKMGRCGLSGVEMPLELEKMPSPNLPVLGPTALMSMNPDTPCQTRYGRTGLDVFPVGKKTAADLDAALKQLTAADREGKNWKRIPGNTRKKSHLLVVYLESLPTLEAQIAEMFTGPGKSGPLYSAICEDVCKALEGRKADDSDLLRVFVLNKIDPGRKQVELSDCFTASEAIRGSAEWRAGAGNRPRLPLKDDEGFVPSPAEVMGCLQMNWERGGASYSDAPGCRLVQVYDLLIAGRPGAAVSARALLGMTLQRASDLLMAIGHATHRGTKEGWKGIAREAGKYTVIAVSIMSIALSKLEQRKEDYMSEPAFLIGRFLSLADTLHAEYCKVARKGDMPPQLLGNALISTAVQDPNKGLARMRQRICVYQAWARGKNGTGLARWSCAEMGKIATEVADKLQSERFNDEKQAQLLLGYLARTEGKEESKKEEGATN
ncbi:MAG: hypothetical protein ACLQVN_25700 [Bryobacteraceae bacterium]